MDFQLKVVKSFVDMYGMSDRAQEPLIAHGKKNVLHADDEWASGFVDESLADIAEIGEGMKELKVGESNVLKRL